MKNRFAMLLIALLVLCSTIASAMTNLKSSINHSSPISYSKLSAKELYRLGWNTINGYGQIKNLNRGLELIIQAANKGYLPAQLFAGKYFLTAKDNPEKALYWFGKAAEQGDLSAQMFCAAAYTYGYGTKMNIDRAQRYLIQAAKNGNAAAQYTLAVNFLKSQHSTNRKLAVSWLKKSAGQGNAAAQDMLNNINFVKGTPAILKQIIANTAAVSGHLTAKQLVTQWLGPQIMAEYQVTGYFPNWGNQIKLVEGTYIPSPQLVRLTKQQIFAEPTTLTNPNDIAISEFISTLGALTYQNKKPHLMIPQYKLPAVSDYQKLFATTLNSAEHGSIKAQFLIGMMYERGVGVEKDVGQAIYWYNKSAEQNYSRADYNIALLYFEGNGVTKNYREALAWSEKAAFKGNAYAQYLLALTHEYGLMDETGDNYIPKDLNYAIAMYHLAASNGYPQAQFNLAELYASGLLGNGDTVQSKQALYGFIVELYTAAAKQNVQSADLALAYYYIEVNNKEKQAWAFSVARKEAEQNNSYAALILALMYDRGAGVVADKNAAIGWYQKAAQNNNPVAEFILGTYYYLGEGISKNQEKATVLLTKAANQNLTYAEYNLALIKYYQDPASDFLFLMKQAAEKNFVMAKEFLANYHLTHTANYQQQGEAARVYQELAQSGYAKAQLQLGYMYQTGIYFDQDFQQAKYWYEKAAQQNNALAQYLLANLYQEDADDTTALAIAKSWYQKGAQQGFVPAKTALGYLYENFYHNDVEALSWYQSAASSDNPQAQFDLGLVYEYGKTVKQDDHKAAEWYSKAAAQNYAPAQYALAILYLQQEPSELLGFSITNNDKKAVSLLEQAAHQRDSYASYQLGVIYETGVGVKINLPSAISYYQQAAAQGIVKAQLALARIYNLGIGVAINNKLAIEYYQQAAETGNVFAKSQLDRINQKKLTTEKVQPTIASIETISTSSLAINTKLSLNKLYMSAVEDLNGGADQRATAILRYITKKHPDFMPAKQIESALQQEYLSTTPAISTTVKATQVSVAS